MLTCKDFLREISDYLDDTCDPTLRNDLQSHIKECPNCWVVFDTTKKTVNVYKGTEPQAVPETVQKRILAAIEKRQEAKKQAATGPPK
ncbi:MAG: zf-HC2 domain-containing protein [Candidatus Solibacter usitatus]|nr:zf-HC2 domain-containing protein [Candidatus Solibacter usitatus]